MFEHFLPLFVGTHSAAPYRIDFGQFHPERLLAFLPHELDFTHLRLMWREWKEKARLRILGHPVTPYGTPSLDRFVARAFRLRFRCVVCATCFARHRSGSLSRTVRSSSWGKRL